MGEKKRRACRIYVEPTVSTSSPAVRCCGRVTPAPCAPCACHNSGEPCRILVEGCCALLLGGPPAPFPALYWSNHAFSWSIPALSWLPLVAIHCLYRFCRGGSLFDPFPFPFSFPLSFPFSMFSFLISFFPFPLFSFFFLCPFGVTFPVSFLFSLFPFPSPFSSCLSPFPFPYFSF